jgi:hypothetical protein
LSAATDNAKELILDKINCGANLAKCHLYLLMLGFDIKDVVSFMTSPAVYLVNDLSNVNMMDSYVNELRMDEAVKLARGKVRADKFFLGSTLGEDEYGSSISIPRIKSVFASLSNGNNSLVD